MGLTPVQALKFRLLAEGLNVTDAAERVWTERYGGPLTLAEYATTGGVCLLLPDDHYVNAPVQDEESGPRLVVSDDQFVVVSDKLEAPVTALPVPAFHRLTQPDILTGEDRPYTDYGVTHTDRCRVSPIAGCAWRCEFCDLPYEFRYRKRDRENMLAVIRAAATDPLLPARHVLVSGGTPRAPVPARADRPGSDDEAWLDDVYGYLAEHAQMPVDVMMAPRRNLDHPEWLRSAGVNMLSVNMEISDSVRARELAPAKFRLGRAHLLRYIERAVEAFDVGFVQSLIVFGSAIEPIESTLRGVRDLVARGCIPVLSPFRPHHLTPLRDAHAATFDEIVSVYEQTLDICSRLDTGVRPGPRCVPCHHNTATLPDETSFYFGLDDDLAERPWLAS